MLRKDSYITYNGNKLLWTINKEKNTATADYYVAETKRIYRLHGSPELNKLNIPTGITVKKSTFTIENYADFCKQNPSIQFDTQVDFDAVRNSESRNKLKESGASFVSKVNFFGGSSASTLPSRTRLGSAPGPEKKSGSHVRLERRAQTNGDHPAFKSMQDFSMHLDRKPAPEEKKKKQKKKEKEKGKEKRGKKGKGKEKGKGSVSPRRHSDNFESETSERKIFDMQKLLQSSNGSTLAYIKMRASNKKKLKHDTRHTDIATSEILIHFKKTLNSLHSTSYLRSRLLILDDMINLLNEIFEDFLKNSTEEIPREWYEELRSHLHRSLIQACLNTLLELDLDHEHPSIRDQNTPEIAAQIEASELLEEMRVKTLISGFAPENFPAFFTAHLEKYIEKYNVLYQKLYENVKASGQSIRADAHSFGELTSKVHSLDVRGRLADNYFLDFVPLDIILNSIFPYDNAPSKHYPFDLREATRNLIVNYLIELHQESKSPRDGDHIFKFHPAVELGLLEENKNSIFIKRKHIESFSNLIKDAIKIESYERDPRKYWAKAPDLFKDLEDKKQGKNFRENFKKWLIEIQENTEKVSLSSLEDNDKVATSDRHFFRMESQKFAAAENDEREDRADSLHEDLYEYRKNRFNLRHPFAMSFFRSSKKIGRVDISSSKLPLLSERLSESEEEDHFRQRVHRSMSLDGFKFCMDLKKSGVNLDFNKLLEANTYTEGCHTFKKIAETIKNHLRDDTNGLITTSEAILQFKNSEDRLHFLECMDQRMVLLKEFISYFDELIKYILLKREIEISGNDCDSIKMHLATAIEQALANKFLDQDLDHELMTYPQERIPDAMRAHIAASNNLETTRIPPLAAGFMLTHLPDLLANNIQNYKPEKYHELLEKLFANIKETGRCMRSNRHDFAEYRATVRGEIIPVPQKNGASDLSDRYFDYIPVQSVVDQIMPYSDAHPQKRIKLSTMLKDLLIEYFVGTNSHSNGMSKFDPRLGRREIQQEKERIYIKKFNIHQLINLLRTELKMEEHEAIARDALENAKKYENKPGDWVTAGEDKPKLKQYNERLAKSLDHLKGRLPILIEEWRKETISHNKMPINENQTRLNTPRRL